MAKTSNAPQFTNLEAQLLKEQYVTSGTAPNFTLTIPNVTSLEELKGKRFTILNHVPLGYGTNVTLNVNGLGAKGISNYNAPNTSFRQTGLEFQIWELTYNGTVFTISDFGDSSPVTMANVRQNIGGEKTFSNQVEILGPHGFGLSSSGPYMYVKQNSRFVDSVGDVRMYSWDGNFWVQKCTVAGASKGGGTWQIINQGASYNQMPFESLFSVTPTTPTTISTTPVDLTPIFGAGTKTTQGADLFTYDATNKVIKFASASADYTNFEIDLRINAIVFGGTNATSQYRFYVARPDGTTSTLPSAQPYIKVSGSANTLVNAQLGTVRVRVNGATDPFVTQGFKIFAVKEVGNDLQLTAGQEQRLLLLR